MIFLWIGPKFVPANTASFVVVQHIRICWPFTISTEKSQILYSQNIIQAIITEKMNLQLIIVTITSHAGGDTESSGGVCHWYHCRDHCNCSSNHCPGATIHMKIEQQTQWIWLALITTFYACNIIDTVHNYVIWDTRLSYYCFIDSRDFYADNNQIASLLQNTDNFTLWHPQNLEGAAPLPYSEFKQLKSVRWWGRGYYTLRYTVQW